LEHERRRRYDPAAARATVFVRAGQAEAWLKGLSVSPIGGGAPTLDGRRCQPSAAPNLRR